MTSGWLTAAVSALRQLQPSNLGVVGPKVYGDGIRGGATTLDVVHRTHLDIFEFYYPPILSDCTPRARAARSSQIIRDAGFS